MNNRLARPHRKAALKLVRLQALIAVITSLIIFFVWGSTAGLSAITGGIISVIPSLIFALYAFRFIGATSVKMVTVSFYRGQSLKLLTTVVLFIIAFKFLPVMIEPLIMTYIITSLAHWFAPIYFNQR
ncbi:MAG: ATP synthase protein I [Alteromonadaceae bacterium]